MFLSRKTKVILPADDTPNRNIRALGDFSALLHDESNAIRSHEAPWSLMHKDTTVKMGVNNSRAQPDKCDMIESLNRDIIYHITDSTQRSSLSHTCIYIFGVFTLGLIFFYSPPANDKVFSSQAHISLPLYPYYQRCLLRFRQIPVRAKKSRLSLWRLRRNLRPLVLRNQYSRYTPLSIPSWL